MTFIDFFAGIGGFRRGLELAGHKCLGFCEMDKYAVRSYRAIHDTEGEWYAEDIRTVRANDIPRADIWCAGFPCQDISIAGKRLGFRGKRSSLFFAVTNLIKDLEEENRPVYLLFENVKNLLNVNRGFDFARILIEPESIGYNAEWTLWAAQTSYLKIENACLLSDVTEKNVQDKYFLSETGLKYVTDIKRYGKHTGIFRQP